MALRLRSRIDRRQAVLGMLAAGGAAALPVEAPAVPTPDNEKAYSAFFLGQGGYLFSWGIPLLESGARKLGIATDVFSYTDLKPAWMNIVRDRRILARPQPPDREEEHQALRAVVRAGHAVQCRSPRRLR